MCHPGVGGAGSVAGVGGVGGAGAIPGFTPGAGKTNTVPAYLGLFVITFHNLVFVLYSSFKLIVSRVYVNTDLGL